MGSLGDCVLTDAVIIKAREVAVNHLKPGVVAERAILNGSYDKGTMITRWIPVALSNLEEAIDE